MDFCDTELKYKQAMFCIFTVCFCINMTWAFALSVDGGTSLIIDKTVPIAQLCIAHRHNLLLLRTGM